MGFLTPVVFRDTPLMREIRTHDRAQEYVSKTYSHFDPKEVATEMVNRAWKNARWANQILKLMAPELRRVAAQAQR